MFLSHLIFGTFLFNFRLPDSFSLSKSNIGQWKRIRREKSFQLFPRVSSEKSGSPEAMTLSITVNLSDQDAAPSGVNAAPNISTKPTPGRRSQLSERNPGQQDNSAASLTRNPTSTTAAPSKTSEVDVTRTVIQRDGGAPLRAVREKLNSAVHESFALARRRSTSADSLTDRISPSLAQRIRPVLDEGRHDQQQQTKDGCRLPTANANGCDRSTSEWRIDVKSGESSELEKWKKRVRSASFSLLLRQRPSACKHSVGLFV
ncbi:unnamed protein product [Heligmosomoides polygyrus]|uniref:Uncharacterized protein n=1 Tax=Heligmosomoides polygyrus TaxID=6339 RepID=A0A183FTL4_HELPZ|nr:unnamed protein product [Heligmosomoides polygyrus]